MELFVGIDVAKGTLAVAQSTGEQWSCANDADGIARLLSAGGGAPRAGGVGSHRRLRR